MVALNQNWNEPISVADTAPKHRKTPSNNNSFPTNRMRSLLRARYYDPHSAEFTSPDPLEYVDGMSLFRGYFVLKAVNPFGLNWQRLLDAAFSHDCKLGYSIRVKMQFPLLFEAIRGVQTWQTSFVNVFAVVTDGKTCRLEKLQYKRLDVNDIRDGAQGINSTDTVDLKLDKVEGEACFLLEVTEKRLGFRTNDNQNWTATKLPVGKNYDATAAQWAKAQRMSGPILSDVVKYIFLKKNCCCCTADQRNEIRELINITSGVDIGPFSCDSKVWGEFLRYGDLGSWQKQCP